jgi:hypothetical protein
MLSLPTRFQSKREQSDRLLRGGSSSAAAGFALRLLGGTLLGATLFALGCGSDQPPAAGGTAGSDVTQQAEQGLDSSTRLAQQEKNDFVRATQQEMDEIKTDLDALKQKADSAQGAAKDKLDDQVRALEEKWNAADAKLAALRAEGVDTWADMKQQVLAALTDLKASYQEMRRHMTQS